MADQIPDSVRRVPWESDTLPGSALELLRHGPHGTDRSMALVQVATEFVTAGRTMDAFERALEDERNQLGEKYREHPDGSRYVALIWRAAEEFQRQPGQPEPALLAFLQAVGTTALPGRRGASLRRLLVGAGNIALGSGRASRIPLSERSLAEASGLTRRTVRTTLRDAVAAGWLVVETEQRGAIASRYALRVPPQGASLPLFDEGGEEGKVLGGRVTGAAMLSPGEDAFLGRKGLASSAYEVLSVLDLEVPTSRTDIAARTGRHPSTVTKALRSLRDVELAERRFGGWVRTTRGLDEVAEQLGTLHVAKSRRLRHRVERREFGDIEEARRRRRDQKT